MRKWQQELVQDMPEVSAPEITEKITTKTEITETHMCCILFLCSILILIFLKPALVTLRNKQRPEESTTLNWPAILILSGCVSGLYWGLQNKIF
jgi:choline-glycine betaine transporter